MSNFVLNHLDDPLPPLDEEPSHPEHSQDLGDVHMGDIQQVTITSILATDLSLGLRRVPAGFYVTVQADGTEWRTSNKPVHVDQVAVEWNERILVPSERSSKVRVSVYASFELGPMLGHGERLRTFDVSVGELRDRSENSCPFVFQPKAGDVVSSCTSFFATVEQRVSYEDDAPVFPPMAPVNGNYLDLDIPISLFQDALDVRLTGHPDRPVTQFHLSMALLSRFARQGFQTDADAAEGLLHEILDTCHANSHIYRAALLAIETSALHPAANIDLCSRRDDPRALDEVMSRHYDALEYYSPMHTARGQLLCNLGAILQIRFQRRGNSLDLDKCIGLQREALVLHPVGHPDRSSSLNNLANGLSIRFSHQGNDQDLDEAIVLHREALALLPVGHPDRSLSLNNLANGLSTRFEHRGNDQDLDEAIVLHREALALRPLHREALALRPVGHPDRSSSLNNLANELSTCFSHRGNDQDLDEAIVLHREALALLPVGHPDQSSSLNNLASGLSTRFSHRGNDQDLDEAIVLHREALALLPVGLDLTGQGSLHAAMDHLKTAANLVSGRLRYRLQASLHWVHNAVQHAHDTELEAYSTSMRLLDTYMSATASVSSRHNFMKDFPSSLAVDAASCALRRGDVCHAVELLEQGRTLIWNQMARFRTPLDNLQDRGDHAQALMKKFRDLSSLLDKPPANHSERTSRVDVEAEATRRLAMPSSSRTSNLRLAFNSLPISRKLLKLMFAIRQNIDKEAGPKGTQPGLIKALREIWDDVVRPVVENLDRFPRRPSRIWWCPTSFFNFLPLHAAGEYKRGGKLLSQLYVSSYTPSLTALIRARRSSDGSSSFAAIGQNHPPGHLHPLEAVEPELVLVQSLLPRPPTVFFTKVTSDESTKSRVLHALQDHHWLHFACHGTQNFAEPFKSAFLMRDQPLSLLDITQTNLSRHEFAFLSACETAVGNFQTPDEAIHLAAGLQFAGVKSVVGTLWTVDDSTVRRLVEAFYKNFCGNGKMDSEEPPERCTERSKRWLLTRTYPWTSASCSCILVYDRFHGSAHPNELHADVSDFRIFSDFRTV
ncbi:CHAT domain-containing protein [Suillus ampliporus]|nr:CHAT domain-containing protein [Suillus ampliporus]